MAAPSTMPKNVEDTKAALRDIVDQPLLVKAPRTAAVR